MINEIKEAYEIATNKGNWFHNGNEFVSELNSRVGIGGFLTDADNELVRLLVCNGLKLLDELEKAQKENEKLLSASKYALEVTDRQLNVEITDNIRLRSEHTTMKMALEWINEYRESLPTSVETYQLADAFLMAMDKASYALSTLSNKEDTTCTDSTSTEQES